MLRTEAGGLGWTTSLRAAAFLVAALLLPVVARATIVISASPNGNDAGATAYSNQEIALFPPTFAHVQSSYSDARGVSADAEAVVDLFSGHIGAKASIQQAAAIAGGFINAGASGKLTYAITLDPGDQLFVSFSLSGTTSGGGSAVAGIFDELDPLRLNFGVFCSDFGCNQATQQTFVLTGTGPAPTPYRIVMTLSVATAQQPNSTANFYNSLNVGFRAPAGSVVIDPFGIVQVPEPRIAALVALSASILAFRRRSRTAGSENSTDS